ncbi:DUF4351 [Candidatus Magnetomoraceae bacterium gMMP-1]
MTLGERIEKRGEKRGEKSGKSSILVTQLIKRFGKISPSLEKGLKASDVEVLDKLGESIFDFKALSDVEKWWNEHSESKITAEC